LGDLVESGEGAWAGLFNVAGLVARRQMHLWNSWRPWAAALGCALPGSFLLMGFSLHVSGLFQQLWNSTITSRELLVAASQALLFIVLSWTGGFAVGSVSRRTLWISIAACALPCLYCLSRFRHPSLPEVCLVLFLVPAIFGVRSGLRTAQVEFRPAIVLAAASTLLVLWSGGLLSLNWVLIWPAWYLVATARKGAEKWV
jgi:hypothetical protein